MTTVSLGFTRAATRSARRATPSFNETADHWRYRLGATQVLTPNALMSANFEAISDDGYLGSPYRVALVFGAAVPERVPSTRSSRAFQLRAIVDLGERNVVRGVYRYFWDNWGITAHTFEVGYARYFGKDWMADAFVRYHAQTGATFFSNNATADTTYVTRNRQLSDFDDVGVGAEPELHRADGAGQVQRQRSPAGWSTCTSSTASSPTCAPASCIRSTPCWRSCVVSMTY